MLFHYVIVSYETGEIVGYIVSRRLTLCGDYFHKDYGMVKIDLD